MARDAVLARAPASPAPKPWPVLGGLQGGGLGTGMERGAGTMEGAEPWGLRPYTGMLLLTCVL